MVHCKKASAQEERWVELCADTACGSHRAGLAGPEASLGIRLPPLQRRAEPTVATAAARDQQASAMQQRGQLSTCCAPRAGAHSTSGKTSARVLSARASIGQ